MKKQNLKKMCFGILLSIAALGQAQLKVMQNGNVAIGISYPNYPLHAYGWAQLFNYNGMEIKFRAENGGQSDIGSNNTGLINFWNANCWANGGWNKLKANAYLTIPDERFKQNIGALNNNLAVIKQLQPKQYNYIDSVVTTETSRKHYGFLAQQIKELLPDLVDTSRGVYALDYSGIIPFLVGAVKEQALTIDSLKQAMIQNSGARQTNPDKEAYFTELKQQLAELQNKVNYFENNCCTSLNATNSQPDKNFNTISSTGQGDEILFQNMPNPFTDLTTIKFNIPAKYSGNFYIKIYKISGEELMSFKVNKESQQIVVNASTLVNGVYNYALIINADILKMKQMIISR